ncbi:MAG: GNAT family N-acetyltransferase [Syntrophales bacterium]
MSPEQMEAVEIDFFRPGDAPGVARLFREVYGEGYPIDIYYDPERLIEENAAGRVLSSVARTQDGKVVGHDALVLLDRATGLYENAAGMVSPACRGQGVFFRLMKHNIFDHAKRFGLQEILGEPVCNHLQLQKMCLQLGYRETGMEVDLMPAAAYTKERSAQGRVSVLLGYFLHNPVPRTVFLPPVYRDELEYLYAGTGVDRTFTETKGGLPAAGDSQGKMVTFGFAQVARISIHRIGSDFEAFILRLEDEACNKSTEVFQVWLPLTSPFASAATDILRAHDYFIGGLLPGWVGGDGLLMQKVKCETDWGSIALYSDQAKRIAGMVRSDQKRTAGKP